MGDTEPLVIAAWKRIEVWLHANDKTGKCALPPGVLPEEIRRVEALLGVPFPQDLRLSYERHNGRYWLCIFEGSFLLPLASSPDLHPNIQPFSVIDSRRGMLKMAEGGSLPGEPRGPIKNDWWNPRWIPIIDDEGGDYVCIDMDPTTGGTLGQVIEWIHEGAVTRVLADSLGGYLSNHADALEAGEFRFGFNDHGGWIERVDD